MVQLAILWATMNGLVVAYYWLLPLLASVRSRPEVSPSGQEKPTHRFALVVPAHNEEATVLGSLTAHGKLDYPRDLYTVFVIADNCTDGTAEVARTSGAVCLERHDADHRGKGQALGWAFERILPLGFDAVVVVDADCQMDVNALRAFDCELKRGARVLQARYAVSNPDATPISYASAVGNAIENDLFYAPKSRLGLAVLLRGTGMLLHREVLEKHPWDAASNTEDVEYALGLIEGGLPIHFLPRVSVWSDFPEDSGQLQIQRRRWASGSVKRIGIGSLRLIVRGALKRNLRMADAGWTLAVMSRPAVLVSVLAGQTLSIAGLLWGQGALRVPVFTLATIDTIALAAYLALGVLELGLSRRRVIMLLAAPWVVAQLVWATLLGSLGIDQAQWRRTPRKARKANSGLEPGLEHGTGRM